jgi:deoxyribonuclease-4
MRQRRNKKQSLLGAHFSIAKGVHHAVEEAVSYGCNTLQMFTKNANTWKEREISGAEIERFQCSVKASGITKLASHTSYLINLASPDPRKHTLSCEALKRELLRSASLLIPFVVHHPGAHMGMGEDKGSAKIAASINRIFSETPGVDVCLLLETTAGQGSGIGHTFEQLGVILQRVEQRNRVGVCLDTCHIFAGGYDIRSRTSYRKTIKRFDEVIGLEWLHVIHLNDSKKGLGSRVDRHEHIGEGQIGIEGFRALMNDPRFFDIPKIIETRKDTNGIDWDRVNLDKLRGLMKSG